MSKEIKFKAFIEYKNLSCGFPDYNLMMDVHSIDFVRGTLRAGNINEIYKIKDVKLLEYTGLKDKNNVEIFDGYIVNTLYGKCVVCWNEKHCCFEMIKDNSYIQLGLLSTKFLEVIGNIYENPELLEK